MMGVVVRVIDDVLQTNGRVRNVLYEVTDPATGRVRHVAGRLAAGVPVAEAEARMAAETDAALAEQEYLAVKEAILDGRNPLRDAAGNPTSPVYNDRTALVTRLVRELAAEEDPREFMKGVPFFSLITDAELMAMLGKTQAEVDALRAKWAALMDAKTKLDSWVPEQL